MNPAVLLGLVLLATFSLVSLMLAALLALAWRAGLAHLRATSLDLLALRLLPSAGALLIALTVVLPAFVGFEPHREREAAGPLLIVLAVLAVAGLTAGIWRAGRAVRAARALLERCRPGPDRIGHEAVHVAETSEPIVAVIGAWRPRIVATESVRAACSGEEFRAVLAHEAAHLAARDNLKLLLLTAAPDALALTPLAAALAERWRTAAECEADQRATGADSERRLALASALIRVARLMQSRGAPQPALGMPVAADDVPGRVRTLLAPPTPNSRARILAVLTAGALLLPLLALPCYALLHELIERLVGLGR
ncbi:MAG TPA: M56 family metallopeptidase [Steroidobacteraceae bacterium]|jgi:Zn-dependent protease with chaperone function|nr:M56 family metallopeptidase [Steroidobacteraceae bacterium]